MSDDEDAADRAARMEARIANHDCTKESCRGVADDLGPCGGCCSCLGGCVYDGETLETR